MKLIYKIKVLTLLICLILASTFISAENAPIDWPAAKAGLRELLVSRAQTTPDMKPRVEAWDEASSWSLDLRARALLLKTDNSLAAPERKNILAACKAIADAILSLETSGDIIKKSRLIKDPAARGWGTVKPTSLNGIKSTDMIEFYCTSSALLGLAEYLPLAKENGADHYAFIQKTLLEVSDYWIKNWMVEHQVYGPYFCKYGITDPRIRDIMVFNTDAQMGLTLRLLARELKNNDQAARYIRLSERLGWQMRLAIFDPITRNGKVDSAAWAYAYIDMAGTPTPQRIEDGNHASYILDFIINLVREKAEWNGKPIFQASDLAVFKTILFDHVMVKDAKGNIVYKFYFDKESTKKSGARQRELVDVYKTEPAEGLESASGWRRYLGGPDLSLDTGHSIRTSWGWAAAFAGDAELLTHLFHTYAAAFGFEPGNVVTRQSQKASAGTLLTLTIFWISLPKN